VLGAGDALIRVHATGITPAELTWAETYRNCDGSERLPAIPGHEVSGVVDRFRRNLSRYRRSNPAGERPAGVRTRSGGPYPRKTGVAGRDLIAARDPGQTDRKRGE
jgi:NADPH:quinone reductase-like Zn-dependent oxidoreductase